MLTFNLSEKGLGPVFSRKMFLMLHSINWPNFTVLLPLRLEILDNICVTIICVTIIDNICVNQAVTS